MMLRLREASGADREFFRSLYVQVRGEEVGWAQMPEEMRHAILEPQFDWQIGAYEREHPSLIRYVIEFAGEPIGRMDVVRGDEMIHVLEVALLSSYRKLGYGRRLFESLQREAVESGRVIRLHVWHVSGAMAFYEKLGFEVLERGAMGDQLQWRVGGAGGESRVE